MSARMYSPRKSRPSRQRKTSHAALVRKADKLFSLRVRSAGRCQANDGRPCIGPLQCAHIFSRRYQGSRWMLANAVSLCAGHHVFYTHRPEEWEDWRRKFLASHYDYVRNQALNGGKQDMDAIVAELERRDAA